MKYIIIGLGNFGGVLAQELSTLGHEVIGVDQDAHHVDLYKDRMTTSFILDATDEEALTVLPLKEVDVVIVSIGEDFGSSVRVVALLKKQGVKHIYARAVDEVHRSVLEAFNLDRILNPEQEAARTLARSLELNLNVDSFHVGADRYVVRFKIPTRFVGYNLGDLHIEQEFDLKVIALLRGKEVINAIGVSVFEHDVPNQFEVDYKLQENDQIVCYGHYHDLMNFGKEL